MAPKRIGALSNPCFIISCSAITETVFLCRLNGAQGQLENRLVRSDQVENDAPINGSRSFLPQPESSIDGSVTHISLIFTARHPFV